MEFGLSESQAFLKDSARKFFAGECPSAEMRRLMETDTAYDAALWSKITEQGYTGIIFPEACGGVGLGKFELMLLMEEAGRALLPGPFFSTVVLAGSVLEAVGSPAHQNKYLAPICRGEVRATVALVEAGASWNPRDVQLSAANGKLTGDKFFVTDAAIADFLVVVARNGVFVVDSKARGLKYLRCPRWILRASSTSSNSRTLRRKKSAPAVTSRELSTLPLPRWLPN